MHVTLARLFFIYILSSLFPNSNYLPKTNKNILNLPFSLQIKVAFSLISIIELCPLWAEVCKSVVCFPYALLLSWEPCRHFCFKVKVACKAEAPLWEKLPYPRRAECEPEADFSWVSLLNEENRVKWGDRWEAVRSLEFMLQGNVKAFCKFIKSYTSVSSSGKWKLLPLALQT